jgi:hypothetical protein
VLVAVKLDAFTNEAARNEGGFWVTEISGIGDRG